MITLRHAVTTSNSSGFWLFLPGGCHQVASDPDLTLAFGGSCRVKGSNGFLKIPANFSRIFWKPPTHVSYPWSEKERQWECFKVPTGSYSLEKLKGTPWAPPLPFLTWYKVGKVSMVSRKRVPARSSKLKETSGSLWSRVGSNMEGDLI